MLPFPLTVPEELREQYIVLDRLAHHLKRDEIRALAMRLKKLKSEALKRSLDWRASGPTYAQSCVMCKGTGQAHFCTDPFCHPDDEMAFEDCLHFTPWELDVYVGIHRDYIAIICEMSDLMSTGMPEQELVKLHDPQRKIHDLN